MVDNVGYVSTVVVSASLSINIASVSTRGIELSSSHLSVGLYVSLSGKCIVAKWLIVSRCRMGWWVGSVEEEVEGGMGVLDGVHVHQGSEMVSGGFSPHWFQWRICLTEMCLTLAWKFDSISIRRIYRWNRQFIGFL